LKGAKDPFVQRLCVELEGEVLVFEELYFWEVAFVLVLEQAVKWLVEVVEDQFVQKMFLGEVQAPKASQSE
jgi:hypothetical protein